MGLSLPEKHKVTSNMGFYLAELPKVYYPSEVPLQPSEVWQ